jgi:hypothetical protein
MDLDVMAQLPDQTHRRFEKGGMRVIENAHASVTVCARWYFNCIAGAGDAPGMRWCVRRTYMIKSCVHGVWLLLLVLTPAVSHADWIFTPHFGSTFGADAKAREHAVIGGALAVFDEDAFGWEADVSFVPDAFAGRYGAVDFTRSDSSVLSLMGNAVIGSSLGGRGGGRFRPYVTVGAGLMQMHVASPDGAGFFRTTTYEAGWNAGAGGLAFITSRIGIRGDIRYTRSFQDRPPSWTRGIDVDVAPGNFDFFRATFGVSVRLGRID